MEAKIEGGPSFSYVHVDLAPGESLTAESDAMSSMAADLDMKARFNGGFFSGLVKKFLGGESLFVNEFSNNTKEAIHLSQNDVNRADDGGHVGQQVASGHLVQGAQGGEAG